MQFLAFMTSRASHWHTLSMSNWKINLATMYARSAELEATNGQTTIKSCQKNITTWTAEMCLPGAHRNWRKKHQQPIRTRRRPSKQWNDTLTALCRNRFPKCRTWLDASKHNDWVWETGISTHASIKCVSPMSLKHCNFEPEWAQNKQKCRKDAGCKNMPKHDANT